MNGASARRARRRAISVLPTPVGPIMRMFLGVISWRRGSCTCWRRQRLRSAIATARLALEFHGDLGEMKTASEQSHYIVPNIDIQLHEKALLSIGVGVGLNEQAEKYTFRNSLQLSYQW